VAVSCIKGLAAFTGFFYERNVWAFHLYTRMWHNNKVTVGWGSTVNVLDQRDGMVITTGLRII